VIGHPMRFASIFLVLALIGCGTSDPCSQDPLRCPDAGLGSCAGDCAPHVPVEQGWLYTVLLWTGAPSATPPACPMPWLGSNLGFADSEPSISCSPCACSPSAAECLLPEQLSAHPAACPGGPSSQPFNAPPLWDGACSAMDAVSSAASVTAVPLSRAQPHCSATPSQPPVINGVTRAQVCVGTNSVPFGTCGDPQQTCIYPKTDGYVTCIASDGDQACPPGWPNKHLVYYDAQACVCVCGDPVGDSCSTTLTVYADNACTSRLASVAVSSSDTPAACMNVPLGSSLGSKSATAPVYTAGTCTPTLTKTTADTLCCLQ
jgi:hypothetical protein